MLDLDLGPMRPRPTLEMDFSRDLATPDLLVYHQNYKPAPTHQIKKLRDTHHTLARALAQGMTLTEAAAFTGRTTTSIQILSKDPTFRELVASYTHQQSAVEASFYAKLKATGLDALDEIQDRLDEKPEEFTVKDLMGIIEMTADRTGHGKVSTSNNLNINVDLATRLENARQRLKALPE